MQWALEAISKTQMEPRLLTSCTSPHIPFDRSMHWSVVRCLLLVLLNTAQGSCSTAAKAAVELSNIVRAFLKGLTCLWGDLSWYGMASPWSQCSSVPLNAGSLLCVSTHKFNSFGKELPFEKENLEICFCALRAGKCTQGQNMVWHDTSSRKRIGSAYVCV